MDKTTHPRCRLVVVTGLSGSGKSTVAKCFEDLGYYVVDNLPLPLLDPFLAAPHVHVEGHDRIAVVTDVRAPHFAERFPDMVARIDRASVDLTLLFLESSDDALVRRFSETRRPHPVAGDLPLLQSIQRERSLLADLRGAADLVLDTSEWSIHETRRHIIREFATEVGDEPAMTVSLLSFGFKHGAPSGADLLFDVRFLPNPHFVPGLRELTGQDEGVRSFLAGQPEYHEVLRRLRDLLAYLLPHYRRELRSYLTIGIGCTGGRHRSVAATEALAKELQALGWPVRVLHRDMARGGG